jgi:hypothetical protein
MKIESIRDLSKLIDLCRKKGIQDIAVDGISLKLGELPLKYNSKLESDSSSKNDVKVEPEYSDEDLMLWSATPHG